MIPLRDDVPSGRPPFVNWAIIGLTAGVFLLQLQGGEELIERYGMIPARVASPDGVVRIKDLVQIPGMRNRVVIERPALPSGVPAWLTLLTCVFLHGGWMHFIGNVWILYIFGDNVEDRFGRVGYLLFYLGSGVLASATHLLTNLDSTVPTIGASGAIAGVMGAYFILFPRAQVLTLIPVVFIHVIRLPAPFFLGIWFLLQFFQGTMAISDVESGGVAWWAHIGGFVVGVVVALVFRYLERRPAHWKVIQRDAPSGRGGSYP
jgi:membrane associated rhomboid family serine protease